MEQLARRVAPSPSRFHERFLAETGETPAAYCLRLRCLRVAECLREQADRPVRAIAGDIGFDNQRYFATCFKHVFGMTPPAFGHSAL